MDNYEKFFKKPDDRSRDKFDVKKAKSEIEKIKERLIRKGILSKPQEKAEVVISGSQPEMSGFQKWQSENQRKSSLFWKKPKMVQDVENNVASKNVRAFLSLLDQEDARIDVTLFLFYFFKIALKFNTSN